MSLTSGRQRDCSGNLFELLKLWFSYASVVETAHFSAFYLFIYFYVTCKKIIILTNFWSILVGSVAQHALLVKLLPLNCNNHIITILLLLHILIF